MKNYGQYHKVIVDGAEYVHREYFIEQFKDRIKQNRDDFEGDEAQSAFDAAIKIINCIGPDGPETCKDEIRIQEVIQWLNMCLLYPNIIIHTYRKSVKCRMIL